jgi:exosortase
MSANVKSEGPAAASATAGSAVRLELPYLREFGILMAAWVALFHFFGNSTLGYVDTSSLFGWWHWTISRSPDEQHAFVMPLAVLGLIYYRRADIALIPKRLWWPGLFLLAMAIGIHLMGYLIQQGRVSVLAFALGTFGATTLFWGWGWAKATLLPFSLLFFCVPLGAGVEPLTFPLRLMATRVTFTLCRDVLGIDVIQRGNQLLDGTGRYQYEVAAACSGIQSLTAIAIFAIIYAFLSLRSPWRIAVLLVSGLPMAVVANVVRLMMIIIAAEVYGQQAGDFVHKNGFFSIVPYIPAIGGVLLVGRWLREKKPSAIEPKDPGPSGLMVGKTQEA